MNLPGGTLETVIAADSVAGAVLGVVVFGALEAGFLGTLNARLDGDPVRLDRFLVAVRRFGLRVIAVALVRFAALAAAVLLATLFVPLGLLAAVLVSYALYGWSLLVVARDDDVTDALGVTLALARDGDAYLRFAAAHVVLGAVVSVPLTLLVRNAGLVGVLVAVAVIAVPAVFVAGYGLLLFRELSGTPPARAETRAGGAGSHTNG